MFLLERQQILLHFSRLVLYTLLNMNPYRLPL